MRLLAILLLFITFFFTLNAKAQLKPNDSQYYTEHNALENAGFENGKREWIVGAGNTLAFGSTELLNQHGSVSVSGNTLDISQFTTKLTDFASRQAVASCMVNTSNSGMKFQVLNNSGVVSELSVIGDGTWRKYEISFVADGTLNALKVVSDSSTVATVLVDDCFLGLRDVVQTVGQAHFVGKLSYEDSNCQWASTSGSYAPMPVDNDCVATQVTGDILAPVTKKPAVRIPNVRTDGYYKVATHGLLYKATADGSCRFTMSSTSTYDNQGVTFLEGVNGRQDNNIEGDFRFTTTGDKEVQILAWLNSGTGSCAVYGGAGGFYRTFTVHFFPDSNATIVSQDTELTAETINSCELTFNMVTNAILSKSAGCPTGISIAHNNVGQDSIVIPSGFYTWFPNVQCTSANQGGATGSICFVNNGAVSGSLTNIPLRVITAGGVDADSQRLMVKLTKTEADVNKSATIVGKFEQIEEVDVALNEFNVDTLSATITGAGVVLRQSHDWITSVSGSAGDYVITMKSGVFSVIPSCTVSANWIGSIRNASIINSGLSPTSMRVSTQLNNSTSVSAQQFTIICSKQGVDVNTSFKGAVINLSDQKVECQTKYLAASVTGTGEVLDWNYTGLTIGKKYWMNVKMRWAESTQTTNEKYGVVSFIDGVDIASTNYIDISYTRSLNISRHQDSVTATKIFTSTTGEISVNAALLTNLQIANGNESTYMQICELPDTYIEGSKW